MYVPVEAAVTPTLIMQLLFGASVPFEKEIEALPALGLNVGEPQLVVDGLSVLVTTTPLGKVSVKFTPLITTAVGLARVIFN